MYPCALFDTHSGCTSTRDRDRARGGVRDLSAALSASLRCPANGQKKPGPTKSLQAFFNHCSNTQSQAQKLVHKSATTVARMIGRFGSAHRSRASNNEEKRAPFVCACNHLLVVTVVVQLALVGVPKDLERLPDKLESGFSLILGNSRLPASMPVRVPL
jgi:hypothetical protein